MSSSMALILYAILIGANQVFSKPNLQLPLCSMITYPQQPCILDSQAPEVPARPNVNQNQLPLCSMITNPQQPCILDSQAANVPTRPNVSSRPNVNQNQLPRCSMNPSIGPCIRDAAIVPTTSDVKVSQLPKCSMNPTRGPCIIDSGVKCGDHFRGKPFSPSFNVPRVQLWPNGTVPYVLNSNVHDSSQILKIHEAMGDIMQNMEYSNLNGNGRLITFKMWSGEANYVEFVKREKCSSEVGNVMRGRQEIDLAEHCFNSSHTVHHELLHALGLIHEHQRPDRDDYINIEWSRIANNAAITNYQRYPDDFEAYKYPAYGPYDFHSVMHYPSFDLGCGRIFSLPSPQRGEPPIQLSQNEYGISTNDANKLYNLYRTQVTPNLDAKPYENP